MVTYVEELLREGFDVVGLFGSWPALKNVDKKTRMIDYSKIPIDELRKYLRQ